MSFTRFDEIWARKEHFQYYRNQLKCSYSLTAPLDVTSFRHMLDRENLRFYPAFVYCVSMVIEKTPEFKMGLDDSNYPGYYDCMHPSYTIFHPDDHTFSDVWTYYHKDFRIFYHHMTDDISIYRNQKGVKVKPNQPCNFYCISCVPWLSYTGYSTAVSGGEPNLFPIITFGKYQWQKDRLLMPFTVTISHAAADGYHTSKFINDLQELCNHIQLSK
ncbi:MAG: chloramphenicol acetyltransferase [Clostridiales bacterium]|nr:chloramphenicol acetyltransferase [Clostridiales bacterium]